MVRSAAAALAVLILPSFVSAQDPAQEPVGTHTVVKEDTLWDLAQRYYSNPFEWRVIWNANRGVVDDPNWIYPAEVLVIPGLPGEMPAEEPAPQQEMVEGVPADLVPFGLRQARPVTEGARTVFYRDAEEERGSMQSSIDLDYTPVSSDAVYSAPWLIGLEGDPANDGSISGFADRGSRSTSIRNYDQITIAMPAPARIGAYLQLFRVERTIEDVGQVVIPTGVAEVQTIGNGEVVAVVMRQYDRILSGDFVRPLMTFEERRGVYAEEVSGGSEAMLMGFAGGHVLTDIGHIAFLDLGSDDGVTIGDEFILFGDAIPTAREGTLQVVGVTGTMASARVLSMRDDVFRQGVVVRLAKKMR
ncbi:MAG: LysM peptidoglycan-binding domain-containing protein [Longimicrobiales bacterium]|jgi:LysM repeat protein/bifunctional DNA-binding transcriptional regulator/antitoxin component of YhaV-PrlF toxin-antitoxin module